MLCCCPRRLRGFIFDALCLQCYNVWILVPLNSSDIRLAQDVECWATRLMLWLLQIMVVVEEDAIEAEVGMGGEVNLTEAAEGEEGGCKVAGKMGTLTILSLAREAGKVAGAEAVADDSM